MQKQFLQPFAMWEHLVRIILRYRLLILLVVLSITVFMGYKGTQVHLSYEMAQMLPESDPVYEQYEEFKKTFGEDGNVVFLGVDDPRFFELENFRVWYEVMQDLKTIEGVTGVLSITNIPQIVRDDENKKFVLEQVMKHKPESQQELDSLVEIVYSLRFYDKLLFNKEMGSVLAAVSVDRSLLNTKDRVYLINNLHERADVFQEETGIDLHYSGLPFIRTTIAEKIESELQLFIFLALIIAAMLLYLFFRGIRAVIFPVFIVIISVIWAFGLIVILGLISAGLSTLEGLIQSVSTTITSDIVKRLSPVALREKQLMWINKVAIMALAAITIVISWEQIVSPKLSVGILAQNGVYAYFSAAFIPVLFGIFLKEVDYRAPLAATLTSIFIHFSVYYVLPVFVENYGLDLGFFTKYLQGTVRNPAIAASTAIVLSTIVGIVVHRITKRKKMAQAA